GSGGGVGQGGGDHVLRLGVQPRFIGVAVGHWLEGGAMALPRLASKEQGIALTDSLAKKRANVVVPVGPRPSTLSEAALGIFVLAAGGLHDAVQRHELGHDNLAHALTPLRYLCSSTRAPDHNAVHSGS